MGILKERKPKSHTHIVFGEKVLDKTTFKYWRENFKISFANGKHFDLQTASTPPKFWN